MSAKEFLADVKNGVVPVNSHEKVLWIAFIYLDHGLWQDNGIFDVVEKLHAQGWSFGEGELRFNRTLDIFYLAQIGAGINRSEQRDGDFPSPNDFDPFYTTHRALLNPSAWRSYYSETFLMQSTTARFYRLPDLKDLPDADAPLGQPRKRPAHAGGEVHATKLPRWAQNVAHTRRQPSLPVEIFTELALRTLEASTARLHAAHPDLVPPYSETQARFWLDYMGLDSAKSAPASWGPNQFGVSVAQGWYDVYAWEGKYSTQAWGASVRKPGVVKPDVDDGTWKSEVMWCGLPDGGIGAYAWWRGWDGEVGGEEEVEFLAALAVEETAGVEMSNLDLAVRSHVLLGVMRAAVEQGPERESFLEQLEKGMVAKGRIKADRVGQWLREALGVVEPYVKVWRGVWPDAEEESREILRRILVENGQLFARWKVSPHLNEFRFELGPRQ
ncbi:hypothetical protein BJX68DRAFT_98185 [Aspergillus pseudodeflectus]|uniref:Rta1 domain protein n=1 Tax=Aspergillus pseudodeflectus TaxID=176178 RepID=A0ABR4KAE6_9EURO